MFLQLVQGQFTRHGQPRISPEQQLVGHRRGQNVGVQAFQIDAVAGKQLGDITDDARAVVAHQLQLNHLPTPLWLRAALRNEYPDTLLLKLLQGLAEISVSLSRYRDPQNSGELARHTRHATLQPVAPMLGDALGQAFDQPRLVLGNHGKNEMIHLWLL